MVEIEKESKGVAKAVETCSQRAHCASWIQRIRSGQLLTWDEKVLTQIRQDWGVPMAFGGLGRDSQDLLGKMKGNEGYFSHCVTKVPKQRKLKKGKVNVGSQFEGTFLLCVDKAAAALW